MNAENARIYTDTASGKQQSAAGTLEQKRLTL
jgi:hypothetical protein